MDTGVAIAIERVAAVPAAGGAAVVSGATEVVAGVTVTETELKEGVPVAVAEAVVAGAVDVDTAPTVVDTAADRVAERLEPGGDGGSDGAGEAIGEPDGDGVGGDCQAVGSPNAAISPRSWGAVPCATMAGDGAALASTTIANATVGPVAGEGCVEGGRLESLGSEVSTTAAMAVGAGRARAGGAAGVDAAAANTIAGLTAAGAAAEATTVGRAETGTAAGADAGAAKWLSSMTMPVSIFASLRSVQHTHLSRVVSNGIADAWSGWLA